MAMNIPSSTCSLALGLRSDTSDLGIFATDAGMEELNADAVVEFFVSDHPSESARSDAEAAEKNSQGKTRSVYFSRQVRDEVNFTLRERIAVPVYHALLRADRAGAKSVVVDAAGAFDPADEVAHKAIMGGIAAFAHAIVADRMESKVSEIAVRINAASFAIYVNRFEKVDKGFGRSSTDEIPESGVSRGQSRSDKSLDDSGEMDRVDVAQLFEDLREDDPWSAEYWPYRAAIARALDINKQLLRFPWYHDKSFEKKRTSLCTALMDRMIIGLGLRERMSRMHYNWDLTKFSFEGPEEDISLVRPLNFDLHDEWRTFEFLKNDLQLSGVDSRTAAEHAAQSIIEDLIEDAITGFMSAGTAASFTMMSEAQKWNSPLQAEIASFLDRQQIFPVQVADRARFMEIFTGIVVQSIEKAKLHETLEVLLTRLLRENYNKILREINGDDASGKHRKIG